MEECPVTVIIPAYNAERFVGAAIQSALDQQINGIEILVVDDGSTDHTGMTLAAFSNQSAVRVLRHPGHANRGVCASRRLAVAEARGELIAFLDADDRYLPGKLARHIGFLRLNSDVVLVHGPVVPSKLVEHFEHDIAQCFRIAENPQTYNLSAEDGFLKYNRICNSTMVCRRSAIWPNDLPESMVFQFEDWVLSSLLSLRGSFHYDPQPLTIYQIHESGFTYNQLKRPGAWTLAHIEFLLTLLGRIRDPLPVKRASEILVDELLFFTQIQNRAESGKFVSSHAAEQAVNTAILRSDKELKLQFLSSLCRVIFERTVRLRFQSSLWWRMLSRLKSAFLNAF